jgi:serine/threonine-protein kinase
MFATTVPRRPRETRPEIPEELDDLVWCALARDREDRFASMDEFIAALEPYAQPGMYEHDLAAFPYVHTEIAPLGVAQLTTTPVHATPVPDGKSASDRFRSPSLKAPWSESGRGAMSAAPSPIPTPAPVPPTSRLPVRRVAWVLSFLVVAVTIYLLRSSAPDHGVRDNVAPAGITQLKPSPAPSLGAPVAEPPHQLVPPQAPVLPVGGEPAAPEPAQMSRSKKPDEARSHHHAKNGGVSAPPALAAPVNTQDAAAEAQRPSEDAQDTLHRAGRVRRDQF